MVWIAAFQWLLTVGIVAGIYVEFPNPQKEFRLCGRRNASFICDPESILDSADGDRLHHLAASFRKSTKCLCSECEAGISLGVFIRSNLTLEKTIYGDIQLFQETWAMKLLERRQTFWYHIYKNRATCSHFIRTMEKYPSGRNIAEMLRKRWHLGKCNDDIVVVLLTEVNISDYSLGPAVQKIFPNEVAELIMKECRIHFLSGWYYQGLESVVTSFTDALLKLQKEKKTFSKSIITGLSLGIGVLLILLILAILLLRRQKKIRAKGCSDIYESVSTENHHEKFLNDKVNKQNFETVNKHQNSDEDDDESEDETNTLSQQFLQIKRHLSAVVEESDDNETLKDSTSFFKEAYPLQSKKQRSLQVTEL